MGKWRLKDLFWVSPSAGDPEPPAQGVADAAESPTRPREIDRVLTMLRDVDGVVGSVAVDNGGELLGSDLPRMFDREALETLALRLSQLRAALSSAETPFKTAAFRYESHALYISQLGCGILGVLAELRTHEPALEMAARLVGQRLEAAAPRASMV
jgi:predicted regulator of Ras-like GTPase activity (Roadblock/LC7/MglB family)